MLRCKRSRKSDSSYRSFLFFILLSLSLVRAAFQHVKKGRFGHRFHQYIEKNWAQKKKKNLSTSYYDTALLKKGGIANKLYPPKNKIINSTNILCKNKFENRKKLSISFYDAVLLKKRGIPNKLYPIDNKIICTLHDNYSRLLRLSPFVFLASVGAEFSLLFISF